MDQMVLWLPFCLSYWSQWVPLISTECSMCWDFSWTANTCKGLGEHAKVSLELRFTVKLNLYSFLYGTYYCIQHQQIKKQYWNRVKYEAPWHWGQLSQAESKGLPPLLPPVWWDAKEVENGDCPCPSLSSTEELNLHRYIPDFCLFFSFKSFLCLRVFWR